MLADAVKPETVTTYPLTAAVYADVAAAPAPFGVYPVGKVISNSPEVRAVS
jgi:hypothetical protein